MAKAAVNGGGWRISLGFRKSKNMHFLYRIGALTEKSSHSLYFSYSKQYSW
jgi:hypothetical protein